MMNWKSIFRRGAKVPAAPADDPGEVTPVILCSICTGEQTAGFRDNRTGKFTGVVRISSPADLEDFRRQYGVKGEIEKVY